MEELSSSKIREYKLIFDYYDRDKDGWICRGDFEDIMRNVISERTLSEENNHIDKEPDSLEKISFEDFIIYIHRKNKNSINFKKKIKEELFSVFKIFDLDNDNKISKEDLTYILSQIDDKIISTDKFTELIEAFHTGKEDKYINYPEFVDYILDLY